MATTDMDMNSMNKQRKDKAKPQQNKKRMSTFLGSNYWKILKTARIIYNKNMQENTNPHEKLSETKEK